MNDTIFQNLNILVIGDIMLDHYIYGKCNRISPEAPVPVVEFGSETYTLGGAGNVLKNLTSLGCKAQIIAVTGNDADAIVVTELLTSIEASIDGVFKADDRCTIVKSRVLALNHQLIRIDRENIKHLDSELELDIIKKLKDTVANYDLVLISDYNKGLLSASLLKEIFATCRDAGVRTIVDPKGNDFSKYKGTNFIKPNKKEAIIATGIAINDKLSLEQCSKSLQQITGCDCVIITMSEEGIAYYTDNQVSVMPTKALGVVDVTGAGDTVLASLGLALASGQTIEQACDFANHAAAIVVSKVGSATVTLDEIKSIIN